MSNNDDLLDRLRSHLGGSPRDEIGCVKCAAAFEIERLRSLLSELIPYLLIDVKSGLALEGAIDRNHDDHEYCMDCQWLDESLEWKRRIESGELGNVSLDDV